MDVHCTLCNVDIFWSQHSTHKSLLRHIYIFETVLVIQSQWMNEMQVGYIFKKTDSPTSRRILSHISCTFCDISWNIFSSSAILVEQSVVLAWLMLWLLSLLSSSFYSFLPGCSDTPFSSIVDASCRISCSSPLACSLLASLWGATA